MFKQFHLRKSSVIKSFGVLLIFGGLFLILYPLYPELQYLWRQYFSRDTEENLFFRNRSSHISNLDENRLIIPEIFVDAPILEGSNENILYQGLWHLPGSSSPNEDGNMIISGHRFLYTHGPKTLYHLPKLKIDDEVIVVWEKEAIHYRVTDTKIVDLSDTSIAEKTDERRLTIYTCTPLWKPEKLFVVIAKPFEITDNKDVKDF